MFVNKKRKNRDMFLLSAYTAQFLKFRNFVYNETPFFSIAKVKWLKAKNDYNLVHSSH